MVYCFQALLGFTTVARRDAVLADMQARIEGKARWGVERLEASTTKVGAPAIACELRFSARADLDDLGARIEAFATGVRTPTAGSWYSLHDCSHDGLGQPCVATTRSY